MNSKYEAVLEEIKRAPQRWLITGVAGFIGSNLLEALLKADQHVVGLDNFATGHEKNLSEVKSLVSEDQWKRFHFVEGDIRDPLVCEEACLGVDYVLHQAALGSVPRSIDDPITTNATNISGHLNVLVAARNAKVKRLVYAASSSTYGDHPALPKVESVIGRPLSPYAITKYVNELYADAFARTYDFQTIGLRYFNVFGPRQDPEGAYAAVIPKWTAAFLKSEPVYINGDGETSRDFCFIENVIQANILAATVSSSGAVNQVYNVAVGDRTTLNELAKYIKGALETVGVLREGEVIYRDFRKGDVRHSLADISKAKELLGYDPAYRVKEGLELAASWYVKSLT